MMWLGCKEQNVQKALCRAAYKYYVNVLELLDGIKLDTLPSWANEALPSASRRELRFSGGVGGLGG